MKHYYKILLFVFLLPFYHLAKAQDTLHIDKIVRVNKGEELKIKEGTIVAFNPGSRIWVEGSLKVMGTKEKPVTFISQNKNEPGVGVVVNGIDLQSVVIMQHVRFNGLLQPLRFEPFWSRKEVALENMVISGSEYNEAVVYVSSPMTNQNEKPISFKILNSSFFNNKSGVIIESAGASGIRHELDNLSFEENNVTGNDTSLGILHLDIAAPFVEKNLILGNFSFIHNTAGNSTIGLSLGGSSENVSANGVFSPNSDRPVYDYYIDPRLPVLKSPLKTMNEWPGNQCYIEGMKHYQNVLLLKTSKECNVATLLDSAGNSIPFTQDFKNDSLNLNYSGGKPKKLVTGKGVMMDVPPVIFIPSIIPVKDSVVLPPPPPIVKDSIKHDGTDTTDFLGNEPFKQSFEIGAWGGLATYVGDLRHKFGIPGIYEWTGGIYFQYNKKRNWSYRATFYRTNIGMHDPTAPLFIWQGAPLYHSNNGVIYQTQSWEANFKTKMYIIDFDAIYYFAPKHDYLQASNRKKGRWIPGVGFGVGFMRFDPYRCVVYNTSKDTAVYVALRPLGMEGQNMGIKKGYGAYTVNFNLSFQLAYVYKRFRFKYELKSVLSMSDYLDDYGQGYTYGGNYDNWKNNVGNVTMPIDKTTGKPVEFGSAFPGYNSDIKRTYNLLPDLYFQNHIGISYDIGDFRKKSKAN